MFFAEVSQRSELQKLTSKVHLEEAGPFELSSGSPVSDAYSHNCKHTCEHWVKHRLCQQHSWHPALFKYSVQNSINHSQEARVLE